MSYEVQQQRTLLYHLLAVGEDSLPGLKDALVLDSGLSATAFKIPSSRRGLHTALRRPTSSLVHTDGSRDDYYRYGSGIFIKSQDHVLRIQRRNPDGCSVFHNELIVIDDALGSLASLPIRKEIWILPDSRSAIQHLSNWQSVRDNVGVSILTKLKRLCTSHQIHLLWIPSHIDLEGNEIADTLAKASACEVPEPSAPLTFLEIFSRTKHQNKTA
ncbi:RNase H domain-containing protein [Trichonephila clavipes]|nr:RNase H domain-containing protein [Trichonephila clavipes]